MHGKRPKGRLNRFWGAICVAAAGAMVPAAFADTSARDYIEPVMTHRQFTIISQRLALPYEQRVTTELLFADYTDTIASIAQQADAKADAAGRQRMLDAFAGRVVVEPPELTQIRLAMFDIYRQAWPAADHALEDLLLGLESVLLDDQRSCLAPALVEARRSMLLHPRDAFRSSYDYAGDGVDVLLLLDEAMNAEFQGLPAGALQRVRSMYEQQLDEFLEETARDARAARMAARIARLQRDEDALRQAEAAAMEIWSRLYDLNHWTVRQASAIARESLGEDAAAAFEQRFSRACFPWLFTRGVPDRQYEWMMNQSLTEEQRERIEEAYGEYLARRAALLGEAQALMITGRRDLKRIVYPMMSRSDLSGPLVLGLFDQLLKNSGELANLESRTSDRFEAALTEQQRLNMRRAIRFGSRR